MVSSGWLVLLVRQPPGHFEPPAISPNTSEGISCPGRQIYFTYRQTHGTHGTPPFVAHGAAGTRFFSVLPLYPEPIILSHPRIWNSDRARELH